ncbi:HK97 family phage prohead protease [Pseudoduganella sp. FT26W]|uniref:HK97 family phage prohead protease n=1 Tax=Duganella aquatilis TaxID=2666082 RepID=A0A844D3W4_9BURK|nr:HK97 family phage prohead protease [Duganella aquatilis]MRW86788.1 HK97 family phage prohead protease [Duganella aquatilis]
MHIKKLLKLEDVSLKMKGDGGTFAGYASVFGGVDSYGDTILKGAYAATLRNMKPKMFFNHEWRMPIGKYTLLKEDDHGLYVEGELTPGLTLASDVRAAMLHETLDGLSIGGFVKKGDYEETETGRIIHKWTSLMEISPVVFPADSDARIDMESVKSNDFELELAECRTERDFERLLRDAGLSRKGAAAVASRAKQVFSVRDAPVTGLDAKTANQVLQRLQSLAQ